MIVRGIDFTSSPSARKPITCATCTFDGDYLTVTALDKLPDLAAFERVLASAGPWIAGLDFPFGQARTLIADLGWPTDWAGYVARVAALRREEFGTMLEGYRNGRAAGAKQPRRPVDVAANACSPMMWYGVPVGKMFHEGAPRLLASPLSILPCRPTADDRIVVETYPALVARRWIGKLSYKADERAKQTPEREAGRGAIVAGLQSDDFFDTYGFRVSLGDALAADCTRDPSGDTLDALLCAIQAAWSYTQRGHNYGMPPGCRPDEGWIPDPALRVAGNKVEPGEVLMVAEPTEVEVVTTYLQLRSRDQFQATVLHDPDLLLLEAREPSVAFYRFLYDEVGREYTWTDRLRWSDERLAAHLARPAVTVLVLYLRGSPAGYVELDAESAEAGEAGTEIVYFGLFPAFHGRGLGKHLLSLGVARAFDDGAARVWLHTCTLDGPHALANYRARGFEPYKTTVHQERVGAHG